ncbi:MAG: bifunctional UDP-N-acetylglucosamine diphosphorylase/glucosamine-1-phosphate N-acetyltransferase GlmU [Thermodesulfobacteriota bacterium]
MGNDDLATIILAAGKGTRMKSDLVKVLHPLLGVPMLSYPIELSLNGINSGKTIVVVGYQGERIRAHFTDDRLTFVDQGDPLGTGHAVLCVEKHLKGFKGTVLILYGDVPSLKEDTLRRFIDFHKGNEGVITVMTTVLEDPTGYGRIVRADEGWVQRIVEDKDTSPDEMSIKEINTGIYCVESPFLFEALKQVRQDNVQGEYYLTDIVAIANGQKRKVYAFVAEHPAEVVGINTRVDLAKADEIMRSELLTGMMLDGVTIVDPKTTYIDKPVRVGRDTVIYPNCYLQGETIIGERCILEPNTKITDSRIGSDVVIKSFSVITESTIEEGAAIGPFARLRPKTEVKRNARIGNFVEVKKSIIGEGTKANHLTYLGDTTVGKNVNIGAGTITCNYDGEKKYPTVIEDDVFVGSNTELIAPVTLKRGSSVGAGSTITRNVPDGALAISRSKQKNIRGWKQRKAKRK